jgi:hypothetical protein
MSEPDPTLKWFMPIVICLPLLLALRPLLRKSEVGRWLFALIISLAVAPVVVAGCPGLSLESAWLILSTLRFDTLFENLDFIAVFLLMPIVITTGVIGAFFGFCSRKPSGAKP